MDLVKGNISKKATPVKDYLLQQIEENVRLQELEVLEEMSLLDLVNYLNSVNIYISRSADQKTLKILSGIFDGRIRLY